MYSQISLQRVQHVRLTTIISNNGTTYKIIASCKFEKYKNTRVYCSRPDHVNFEKMFKRDERCL